MSRRPHVTFRGQNVAAYESREPEILLAGAAGTGKSLALLFKCLTLLTKYQQCRGLFCRGTRASLTQSGLVTWEEILERTPYASEARRMARRVRQSYEFPNGAEFVVAGLDDPGKTLSSQYDFIYIQEATEEGVDLNTYETLLRCLRNPRMRRPGVPLWRQLMADCNPTTPSHFLYRRWDGGAGPLKLYTSTHRDNPAYWDAARNDWTEDGRDYVLNTLARMTGARRKRFYLGQWAAAEGLVYDGYAADVHNHEPGWRPPAEWPRVWGIDWGFTNPSCLLIAAVDPDGRAHVYREFYKTHTRAEELAEWALKEINEGREPVPVSAVCDHDPECHATFQKYCPLVPLSLADKGDKTGGIEACQGRFDIAGDGKPRIFVVPDMRAHEADDALEAAGKPTGFMEELVSYIWDTRNPDRLKDEPLDKDNHACFVAGTMVATERGQVPIESVRVGDRVWTRQGLKPVVACGPTAQAAPTVRAVFCNGAELIGTPNHPVYECNRGWTQLEQLSRQDKVTVAVFKEKLWKTLPCPNCRVGASRCECGSGAKSTADTLTRLRGRIATTSAARDEKRTAATPTSIANSGSRTTGRFRTVTKSTTRTATRSTTPSTTSNCSPLRNTSGNTPTTRPSEILTAGRACPTTKSALSSPKCPSGTPHPRAASGTANTPKRSLLQCLLWMQVASNAVRSSRPKPTCRGRRNSAASTVGRRLVVRAEWITNREPAIVAPCSRSIGTPEPSLAHASVLRCDPMPPAAVYNLTVAECPEYFANGVLVHNCDALRYLTREIDNLYGFRDEPVEPASRDPFSRLNPLTFR